MEPEELWLVVRARSRAALASGALRPTPTRLHGVEDAGVLFAVRVRDGRDAKRAAAVEPDRLDADPFLPPYDPDLFVADLSPTHVALLNKFNVLEDHLLIATRAFEPQEALLTPEDFAALWSCMGAAPVFGFYNGGLTAGASQPHKHLQLIRLPVGDPASSGPPVPTATLLAAGQLPFQVAHARLDPQVLGPGAANGEVLAAMYRTLLDRLDLLPSEKGGDPSGPYNLLLTRDWMALVPRAHEAWEGISINAMGFAGALLVSNSKDLTRLREYGILRALAQVGIERA